MSSVDVFVPCYRYGHFLRECVKSVLSQSGVSVRVLIIDDASPDPVALQDRIARSVDLLRLEQNGGVAAARRLPALVVRVVIRFSPRHVSGGRTRVSRPRLVGSHGGQPDI